MDFSEERFYNLTGISKLDFGTIVKSKQPSNSDWIIIIKYEDCLTLYLVRFRLGLSLQKLTSFLPKAKRAVVCRSFNAVRNLVDKFINKI